MNIWNKEIAEIFFTFEIFSFVELEKFKLQKGLESITTYALVGNGIKSKIREKKYDEEGRIVYELSCKREHDFLTNEWDAEHTFEYKRDGVVIETITGDPYDNPVIITRQFNDAGDLMFERTDYRDSNGQKEFYFFYDKGGKIDNIKFFNSYLKGGIDRREMESFHHINLSWENDKLMQIESVRFLRKGRFRKEYWFLSYNEKGAIDEIWMERFGSHGVIKFEYENGVLVKKISCISMPGMKAGKYNSSTKYDSINGTEEIIRITIFDRQYYSGEKHFFKEKVLDKKEEIHEGRKRINVTIEKEYAYSQVTPKDIEDHNWETHHFH